MKYKGLASAGPDRFKGPSGKTYIGRIIWRGVPDWDKLGFKPPQDYISFLVEIGNRKIWLSNYEAIFRMKSATRGYYQLTKKAEKKIQ